MAKRQMTLEKWLRRSACHVCGKDTSAELFSPAGRASVWCRGCEKHKNFDFFPICSLCNTEERTVTMTISDTSFPFSNNQSTTKYLSVNAWTDHIHRWAIEKEWWDLDEKGRAVARNLLELLMLATTELAEAAEEVRNGREPDEVYAVDKAGKRWDYNAVYNLHQTERKALFGKEVPKPEGFGIELADTIIRILDTAGALGLDMAELMRVKMMYNATRPPRHGGKKA